MKTTILVLMLIVAIGVLIFVRRAPARNVLPASVEMDVSGQPYHCVVIRYPDKACAAVKRLSGQRLLSKEAPRLPLPQCDVAVCRCRYAHFADRRHHDDRRDSPTTIWRAGDYALAAGAKVELVIRIRRDGKNAHCRFPARVLRTQPDGAALVFTKLDQHLQQVLVEMVYAGEDPEESQASY